jgi:hypothetical protein
MKVLLPRSLWVDFSMVLGLSENGGKRRFYRVSQDAVELVYELPFLKAVETWQRQLCTDSTS